MNNLFGYVSVLKDELKIREYHIYRSYYCGLCKTLGKQFSQVVRLGLNYDFAFLALTMGALSDTPAGVVQEHCIIHPISRRPISQDEKALSYAAYMSIMVTYFKLIDDRRDLGSLKSMLALMFYKSQLRKCKKKYQRQYTLIETQLKELNRLEKEGCTDIDLVADCFAQILGCLFVPEDLDLDEKASRALHVFGYQLGRFIYIIDAFQDIREDAKHHNYNPILLKERKPGEEVDALCQRIREKYLFTLSLTLDAVAKSFELIPFQKHRPIIENVVYLGLRGVLDKVMMGKSPSKGEKNESI